MARRSVDWNKGLAEDLRKTEFAQEFIKSLLDEGLPLQAVLGKVVRAYGVKEFAAKAKLPSSNLLRAVNPRHNPTLDTVNTLLRPFGLRVTVGPVNRRKRVA